MDVAITIVMLVPVLLAVALIINVIRKNVTERQAGDPVDIRGAIPAIIVLLVAVLVIGSMAEVAEDREYELYDCVPLSSFGSGATIEGDCAEVVTIGGTEYVRMTDVGTFTATVGEKEREYRVTMAHMDLVLLTGQSNSVYFTNPSYYTEESPVAPGKAFYLGSVTPVSDSRAGVATPQTVSSAAITDLVGPDGKPLVSQMYPAFCSDYVKETGHRVLVVNTGLGGQSIASWDDGGDCDRWMETAFSRLSEVVSGSVVLTPAAVLWSQGESDRDNGEEYYYEKFKALVERLEAGEWGGCRFPMVLTSLPRYPGYDVIDPALAQIRLAEEDPTVTVASSLAVAFGSDPGDVMRDGVHYSQDAFGWFGEAFARAYAGKAHYAPVAETLVWMRSIAAQDELADTIDVYGTSGKAYSLDVSWSLDGGVWVGTLSGNPRGTVIDAGLVAEAPIYTYDSATRTLTIARDLDSVPSWGSAASARALVIQDGVEGIAAGAFAGLGGLASIRIQGDLTTVGSGAFPTLKDYAGVAISSPTTGDYAGAGDGTLYLCDPSLYSYDGTAITGLASGADPRFLAIPSEHSGAAISAVGGFRSNASIEGVFFLDDSAVTAISDSGFRGCSALTTFMMPDTVTTIGGQALAENTSLTTVHISESLRLLSFNLFYGDSAISAIDIPDSVTELRAGTFNGCTGVTSVTIGDGLATVASNSWDAWTFYASDGTTVIDKTVASNLAGHTFAGTASALVMQS